MKCLVCEAETDLIIDFGKMPIANGFILPGEKEYFYNLELHQCPKCSMVQIEQPPRELMFNDHYPFFSSSSVFQQRHFAELAKTIDPESFVVEIGSNDGIFIQHFPNHLGIEPSENVFKAAIDKGLNCLSDFFDEHLAMGICDQYGQADVIFSANCLCHISDIHSVLRGVKTLLKHDGLFIFEDPYLGDIIDKGSFDQIYDEHAFYFSIKSVDYLMDMHNLAVYDAQPQNVHGGSMRYIIKHKDQDLHPFPEREINVKELKEEMEEIKSYLNSLLRSVIGKVVGYGATSKSTTLLNYCGIGPDLIDYIVDTTPEKQGKLTPGSHIPIRSMDHFKDVDYALLLAWNHQQEIMAKESNFGGKWITYIPKVRVI